MTTLVVLGDRHGENATAAVNRRLREELASLNLSGTAAADQCGVKQQWLSRRMTGVTDWAVGELETICGALGLSFAYIMTGIRELPLPPSTPAAGPQPQEARILHLPIATARKSDDVGSIEDDALAYVELAERDQSRLGESNSRPIHYKDIVTLSKSDDSYELDRVA